MSDKPEDLAKRAHAMGRLGGLIFKSQAEIDQKAIASAESPEDERFVQIAERVKSYIEEVGIEIRFGVRNFQLRYELNLDLNIAPAPWVAELLVVAWHSCERVRVDRPTTPQRPSIRPSDNAVGEIQLTDLIRITYGDTPTLEHSIDDMETVVRVLASVRDRLLAEHEAAHPMPAAPAKN